MYVRNHQNQQWILTMPTKTVKKIIVFFLTPEPWGGYEIDSGINV
jgi:hypothetical protein